MRCFTHLGAKIARRYQGQGHDITLVLDQAIRLWCFTEDLNTLHATARFQAQSHLYQPGFRRDRALAAERQELVQG